MSKTVSYRALCAGLTLLVLTPPASAGDWPCWRGPHRDGTSDETSIPIRWSRTENICWNVAIPGKGHSSPIVWGDRIFLTTCQEKEEQRLLLCLDRHDGKLLWQRVVVTAKLEPKHQLNSYASSTPATDGRHVWVSFMDDPNMAVCCYDFDGKQVWRRSPGEFHSRHGFCSPAVLYKDLVILNGDQDDVAYLVALDKATGAERWRADRPNRTRSYCPPIIIDAAGKKQLVLSGSKCVASYDPDTGKQIWLMDGPTEQFVASLVYRDNVIFLTAGFPEHHIMGIRPDGEGKITRSHILWRDQRGASYVPSPIAHGDYFFLVSDEGIASCLEIHSGKRRWMEHLGRHHSASAVSAGDYLYFPDDDGTTFVVRAGPKFEIVSRNVLGEECSASPAIANGQLFLRTLHHLWCIGSSERRQRSSR
jgi:outer membrane protein assembly factor BamB